MLSYQHEYHAGNHADILKHTCLCLLLSYLCQKEKPFTVIDSHAGSGIYNLDDEKSLKTGEAKEGIEKVYNFYKKTSTVFPSGIKDYLELEASYLEKRKYAGSPEISLFFAREKDSLHFVEKHPASLLSLKENTKGKKVHIHGEDAFSSLSSLTPPLIKRGLILIDPSYEDTDEYEKVSSAIKTVRRKWNTAIIALWYPLLLRRKNETARLLADLEDFCKIGKFKCETSQAKLIVKDPEETKSEEGSHLYGSGMFIINPPWKLQEKLDENITFIKKILEVL